MPKYKISFTVDYPHDDRIPIKQVEDSLAYHIESYLHSMNGYEYHESLADALKHVLVKCKRNNDAKITARAKHGLEKF